MQKECQNNIDNSNPYAVWGPYRAPAILLNKRHHQRIGADKWDNERVADLCKILSVTLDELCSMAGVYERVLIKRYWRKDKYWPVPVGLHFTFIWDAYFTLRYGNDFINTL